MTVNRPTTEPSSLIKQQQSMPSSKDNLPNYSNKVPSSLSEMDVFASSKTRSPLKLTFSAESLPKIGKLRKTLRKISPIKKLSQEERREDPETEIIEIRISIDPKEEEKMKIDPLEDLEITRIDLPEEDKMKTDLLEDLEIMRTDLPEDQEIMRIDLKEEEKTENSIEREDLEMRIEDVRIGATEKEEEDLP